MLIGNKVAERDIRDHLNKIGYVGRSARFEELELHAIERPGWLQFFRFQLKAENTAGQSVSLFGILKDDERFKLCEIRLFENRIRRDQLLSKWTLGLTRARFEAVENKPFSRRQYFRELGIFVTIIALILVVIAFSGFE